MDREEAIAELKQLSKNETISKNVRQALLIAIPDMEKQLPMRPNLEGDGYDEEGYIIVDIWICPDCGERYELDYDCYSCCPECGQRIDELWLDRIRRGVPEENDSETNYR